VDVHWRLYVPGDGNQVLNFTVAWRVRTSAGLHLTEHLAAAAPPTKWRVSQSGQVFSRRGGACQPE